MTQRNLFGYVWVDSGTVWVGDPCYVIGNDSSYGNITQDEYLEKNGLDSGEWSKSPHVEPFGEGIGMEVKTAFGDGSYPVYADLGRNGEVLRLIIDFDPAEED